MRRKITARQEEELHIISSLDSASIGDILPRMESEISQVTLNRDLASLVRQHYLKRSGKGRATRYTVSANFELMAPVDLDFYFEQEPDIRGGRDSFHFGIFELISSVAIFSDQEHETFNQLQSTYTKNILSISPTLYKKEMERLTIELSWKSSQIEGNTYSLLETERLFLEKEEAKNRTKEEAIMLLNHKEVLQYVLSENGFEENLRPSYIEQIHSVLTKDLGVGRNIRARGVGITGTHYRPLDNQFQIQEALGRTYDLINEQSNGFLKSLLAILLISYIQPFEDGNKRTARIIGNALLMSSGSCPLSYRSVDSIEYKKALILFYERNNLSAFKELFIEQTKFGVANYFR